MQQQIEEYLTITELAKLLGVTTQTLRRWEKLGKIQSYKVTASGRRRFKRTEINHLIQPNYGQ